MNILVCGSRSINDKDWVFAQIDSFVSENKINKEEMVLVDGNASGVDKAAIEWAAANNVKVDIHKPDWGHYKQGAGIRRNEEMVGIADNTLILWDGSSRGTKNDINLCKRNFKPYKLVIYPNK